MTIIQLISFAVIFALCGVYLALEKRITSIFLSVPSAKINLTEQLIYRTARATAELFIALFMAQYAIHTTLLWIATQFNSSPLVAWAAQFNTTIVSKNWIALSVLFTVRFLIFLFQEKGKSSPRTAKALHTIAFASYAASMVFMPQQQMPIIVLLLVLHFIGDFTLQAEGVACDKGNDWRMNLGHAAMYASPCAIVLLPMGHTYWMAVGFIFLTHLLIDPFKARWELIRPIWVDQLTHISVLILVAYAPSWVWVIFTIALVLAFIITAKIFRKRNQATSDDGPITLNAILTDDGLLLVHRKDGIYAARTDITPDQWRRIAAADGSVNVGGILIRIDEEGMPHRHPDNN